MKKFGIIMTVMVGLFTVNAIAAVYSYKCARCGLIQSYAMPGTYKCPKDGSILLPVQ